MAGRRSSGIVALWAEAQRRQQRQQEAQRREWVAAQRAHEQAQRAAQRAAAHGQRAALAAYQQAREAEASRRTADIERRVNELQTVLAAGVTSRPFTVGQLKTSFTVPPFSPGRLAQPLPMPNQAFYQVPQPTGLQALSPAARRQYQEQTAQARSRFERDWQAAHAAEQNRLRHLAQHHERYLAWIQEQQRQAAHHNAQVDDLWRRLQTGESQAVAEYFAAVLYGSTGWPADFPRLVTAAWDPAGRQLVLNWQLPDFSVVPQVARVRYVKTDDRYIDIARAGGERTSLYRGLVAQCTLRVIVELFRADVHRLLESVAVNGMVDAVDPATGREDTRCLTTVMVSRDQLTAIALDKVDAADCLLALRGQLSPRPERLTPIRPGRLPETVGGGIADQRDDTDINLYEIDPEEFEDLLARLFQARGFRVMTTARSGDEGVDVIAEDPDPITGGHIVIQAKRYRSTVSPAVVRDLYGTVQHNGAIKGILVTTSSFGPGSHDFARNKPITLINGAELVDLLARHGLPGHLGKTDGGDL